jgi:lysozyme
MVTGFHNKVPVFVYCQGIRVVLTNYIQFARRKVHCYFSFSMIIFEIQKSRNVLPRYKSIFPGMHCLLPGICRLLPGTLKILISIPMIKVTSTSKNAINLITHFEGLSLKSYQCPANIWTIGYNTTIYPDGTKVGPNESCSDKEAAMYLKHDLGYFEKMVDVYTRHDVSQNQFDALVSFCYNVGTKNLKDSALLRLINHDPADYMSIQAQWLRWRKLNGSVIKGLIKRRCSEFYHYKTGQLRFDF